MSEKLDNKVKKDIDLKQELDKITWPVDYGTVTVQVRDGKATLAKVERTIKLD